MIKQLSIIIVFTIFGCTSQKKQLDTKISSSSNEIEILIGKAETNDNLVFNIQNRSSEGTITLRQNKLHIERKVNNQWEKIKVLNCPCGAPCARQSELIEIPSGNNYVFIWNKKESWCGKKSEKGIPETIETTSQQGLYRVRFVYSTTQNKQQVIYQEFNVY